MIIFGTAYKKLSLYQTDKDNHQYQKQWDDAYINRLFTVNFINFYLPLFLVAFYTRRYEDLFIMMCSQMACKQIALNVLEWLKPVLTIKPKLQRLNQQYAATIKEYQFDPKEAPMKAGRKEATENPSIREYQAIRDLTLAPGGAGVLDCYMELVAQFGFIVLFSEIFPPAALFSLLSNNI